MEGHPLCQRGFLEDSTGLDNIVERGEKKERIIPTSVPWVTEKRTPFRDITDKRAGARPIANESSSPSHRSYRRSVPSKGNWRSWSGKGRRKQQTLQDACRCNTVISGLKERSSFLVFSRTSLYMYIYTCINRHTNCRLLWTKKIATSFSFQWISCGMAENREIAFAIFADGRSETRSFKEKTVAIFLSVFSNNLQVRISSVMFGFKIKEITNSWESLHSFSLSLSFCLSLLLHLLYFISFKTRKYYFYYVPARNVIASLQAYLRSSK